MARAERPPVNADARREDDANAALEYLPHVRAERLIASGRAYLLLFALVGVLLDPLDRDAFADNTLRLLAVYTACAVVYWLLLARGMRPTRRTSLVTHVCDLTFAVILTMITRGSGSPYFLFFTFLLLCAAVRWGGSGAWWTGVTVMAAEAVVGLSSAAGVLGPGLELNRFGIRFGLLFVMTLVLTQVGTYQRTLYEELRQLARWPRNSRESLDEILREELGHAAQLLDVRDVFVGWRFDVDAAMQFARWNDGRLERWSDPLEAGWPLLPDAADAQSFLFDGSGSRPRTISGIDPPRERPAAPLDPRVLEEQGVRSVIGAPLRTAAQPGWVLLMNRVRRPFSIDDLILADIVAGELSRSLERWAVMIRAREAVLGEERLRVARDLHDGILQSLTGCRLGISGAASSTAPMLPAVADELTGVERALAHEQQELRRFIQHLRPASPPARGASTPLRELCDRVQRQWHLSITVHPDSEAAIPASLSTQVLLLCHEALVNAARHARPRSARVRIQRIDGEVHLTVADDGCGFPFEGRYDAAQLAVLGIGPRTLRERAESLGGTLTVVSTSHGSTVEIHLPVGAEAVCA
jgi:signal transduction histidine kinase